ncbi:MAG: FkbM family methyltransferase, partial [Candidatus Kuenenia stuttgartiensis]|nr:FkbM family methyltransferase [Candidatus Kuenenia stuttgartiensis]
MIQLDSISTELRQNNLYREKLIQAIVGFEKDSGYPYSNVRDLISGPLCDLLFTGEKFTKRLQNGLTIKFVYNSKIAREFLLSTPSTPNHVWEPQTTKLLLHFSQNARNVIFAGAYFGDQTIPVAYNIVESGKCHAFEPNLINATLITENAKENGLSNVIVNHLALWNKSNERLVFEGEDALASTIEAGDKQTEVLHTITIDDYVKNKQPGIIDLLMIDVEGSEIKVLEGAANTIKENRPTVIFETHSLYDDWSKGLEHAPSVLFMKNIGYEVFAIREFHQNIDTGDM